MSFGCGDSVLVHKRCWHCIDFGMVFFDVLMLSLYFLQVASHFQLPSVLDLSVLFFLLPRLFVCFLCRQDCEHLRRGCFIQGALQIQRPLHAPAVVSKLFQVRRREHNVHGKQKYKPACGDPWRGDSQACPVFNKNLGEDNM